jgi:hypothetical protein
MRTFKKSLLTAVLALLFSGCDIYHVIPVDITLKNDSSLPVSALVFEREATAYRTFPILWSDYTHYYFTNNKRESLDLNGHAHFDEQNFFYQHKANRREWTRFWLLVERPNDFGDIVISLPKPTTQGTTKLRCIPKNFGDCSDVIKLEWELETVQPEFDLLLVERTIRLTITREFSQIIREQVSRQGRPSFFFLEYVARQAGSPLSAFGRGLGGSDRLEQELWVRGQRKIDLKWALAAERDLVIEMPVLILTSRSRPEFEERIRLVPDVTHAYDVFDFPVLTVSNNEKLSEILLDRERYDWLMPQVRQRQNISRMFDAIYAGDMAIIRALLASGLNPHALDVHGYPLFYRAVQQGKPEMINLFIKYGANVEDTFRNLPKAYPHEKKAFQEDLDRKLQLSPKRKKSP